LIFGSGKFGTPCARTHAEYATAWLPGEAEPLCELAELDDEPPELADEPLEEVLDPRFATVGVFVPPPHPATSSASPASPAIGFIAFISSSPRAGLMVCARQFYGTAGYTTVSDAVTAL
jgi:hypothetical protein